MFNGTVDLHGTDGEQLAARVLTAYCRRKGELNPSDREDALAYLVATGWELSLTFDPERGVPFDSYAYSILSLRVTDWLRKDEGRTRWQFAGHTYERERPKVLSLDAPAHAHDAEGHSLGQTLAGSISHSTTDPDPDDAARLLAESRRRQDRDHRILREAAAVRASRRAA
jgi:hypothetical protein